MYIKHRQRRRCSSRAYKILSCPEIIVVETDVQWQMVSSRLITAAVREKVLGFDCEWVSSKDRHVGRVALLQLATADGLCGLLRLEKMARMGLSMPQDLKDLLADKQIVKCGVGPEVDAKKLMTDYGLFVQSYLDLGWLAAFLLDDQRLPGFGLKSLAKFVLDVDMDKSWTVRCSDWESDVLTERQINYAATDALVSIEIFVALLSRRFGSGLSTNADVWLHFVRPWLDRPYKHRTGQKAKADKYSSPTGTTTKEEDMRKYGHSVRRSPLYHNCTLQAPDGDPLCTCDVKKINWYLEKNLAELVSREPLVARLKFEPSRRPTLDQRYYLEVKENRCVVCGVADSYIRKNIVPRDYRRHFPSAMKDHRSHDVVLLCTNCHRQSNQSNVVLQRRLAEEYDVPLDLDESITTDASLVDKKVKSAANALTNCGSSIPPSRRRELEAIVCEHFSVSEITDELLAEALKPETKSMNNCHKGSSSSHGLRVVQNVAKTDGLLHLESRWRQHFLATMRPKFLPALWSSKHGHDLLRADVAEGTADRHAIFGHAARQDSRSNSPV